MYCKPSRCAVPTAAALWWNVRQVYSYSRSHTRFLVNYGARHRKGLPISSSIAESAVNTVVSARMAKKQQMRWSDEEAHGARAAMIRALRGGIQRRLTLPVTCLAGVRRICRVNTRSRVDRGIRVPPRCAPARGPFGNARRRFHSVRCDLPASVSGRPECTRVIQASFPLRYASK
jgi:hypothetical protein